jgi:hypothetical protein
VCVCVCVCPGVVCTFGVCVCVCVCVCVAWVVDDSDIWHSGIRLNRKHQRAAVYQRAKRVAKRTSKT